MSNTSEIEKTQLALLTLLTWRVRAGTTEQLVEFGMLSNLPVSRMLLSACIRAGWLQHAAMVISFRQFHEPLFTWKPNELAPDCEALAWKLTRTRQKAIPKRVQVYWATKKAERLTAGVSGAGRQPLQIEHDLGTTQIFLKHLKNNPETGSAWMNEDILSRCYPDLFPRKIPDAVLMDQEGGITLILECAGQYSAKRIRQFHRFCQQKRTPYEIW